MTNHVLSTMCVMLHFSLRTQKYDPPHIMYNVCNALSKFKPQIYDPPRIEYNVCNASFQFKNTKI